MHISDIFRTFIPMKEQVTDISKVLLNIAEEMRLMRETINQQHTEITKLNRNIESLNHQLRKKNEEIAKLKTVCPNTRPQTKTQATAVRLPARNA